MNRPRGRLLTLALIGTLAAAFHAGSAAAAGPGFFVGADEDSLLWGNSAQVASIARSAGLRAIRITLPWQPGQTTLGAGYQTLLNKLELDANGLRVVVGVYGKAEDAPRTDEARGQYCDFVANLLRTNPQIDDVVIWNDPNDNAFWSPQFDASGGSLASTDYEALLARCWDAAHAVRQSANVVSLAVSKSSSIPGGFTLAWHPPGIWIDEVAAAYRASGRTQPIFDTFGYIPHPTDSAERPWTRHPSASAISIGDYDELMTKLTAAFDGTPQPVPGQGSTTIWYLAQGYQTTPDPAKASLYTGSETDPAAVPSWSDQEAADPRTGPGFDQPMQLADAIALAYCQPNVGAYFNFHLVDERDLAGWQSGVFWPDGTPKAAYQALHHVAVEANAGQIDCASFSSDGSPPRPQAVQRPSSELQLTNVHVASLSPNGGTIAWQTSNPAKVEIGYGLAQFGVPTMWAQVSPSGGGYVAALKALDRGRTYKAWISAVGDDGQRAQTAISFSTPGIDQRPTASIGKSPNAMLLDGAPFFPMIVYSICPYQYGAALSAGINLFALNACGTLQAQLNALGGSAYSAGVAGGTGGSGPGLVGWFNYDEPDGANVTAAELPDPPAGVPGISFMTLTNHFYSNTAPLPWGRGTYPSLIAKADMIGFDLYPLQGWCRPSRLADVYYAQRELVKLAGDKPTFQWIEADDWKCPGGQTNVTPAVVRAESWMAIAGGAHGLGFWPASWPTANAKAIAAVGRDVARLGDAVYMPDADGSDTSPQVVMSVRSSAGATYVIAVNSGFSATDTTFTVPSLNGRTLSVLGESRRVPANGDSFSDHFGPLDVHIYIAAPADGG